MGEVHAGTDVRRMASRPYAQFSVCARLNLNHILSSFLQEKQKGLLTVAFIIMLVWWTLHLNLCS